MRKLLVSAVLLVALPLAAPSDASPKPCRNAAGKIIECPKPKPNVHKCKDAAGKFVKCGTPGARPAGGAK
jgi:hypothetical protein